MILLQSNVCAMTQDKDTVISIHSNQCIIIILILKVILGEATVF